MTDDAIAILKKRYNISDESIAQVIQEEKDLSDPERIAQVFEDIAKLEMIMDNMEREIVRLRASNEAGEGDFKDIAEENNRLHAENDRMRKGLENIILHARDELDVRIAREALEQK